MPEIFPPPSLIPASGFIADLLAAALALLDADPECGTGGSLGVAKIEAAWDQPKEPRKRAFAKAERPAIVIWAELGEVGTPVLCAVNSDTVRLHVQVVVDSGNNQEGRALALAIQYRALQQLQAQKYGGERFVEGYEINPNVTANSPGEPRLAAKNANLFVSESTTDFGVLWMEVT